MTKAEANQALVVLSKEFNVPVPELHWLSRLERGAYAWTSLGRMYVALGPTTLTGTEVSLLHEFSHHVACCRHGWLSGKDAHGPKFTDILIDVVWQWFGTLSKYPWHQEYKQVYDYVLSLAKETP
jgi:hypothetical protein